MLELKTELDSIYELLTQLKNILDEEETKEKERRIKENTKKIESDKDEIFLLNKFEYIKYKEKIPSYNDTWWLRKDCSDIYNDCVSSGGEVVRVACSAYTEKSVRPVIRHAFVGNDFVKYENVWTYIGDNLYISKRPIWKMVYNEKSCMNTVYADSSVRKLLLDWIAVADKTEFILDKEYKNKNTEKKVEEWLNKE